MVLVVMFDCDADIVDVPEFVIARKDILRKNFIKWIYNKNSRHSYWESFTDIDGKKCWGVSFRGNAFVEWLNKKVLPGTNEQAMVIEQYVSNYDKKLPIIYF